MDSQTDIEELITWLETDEAASREWRARRLRHLLEAIKPPKEGMFFLGEESFHSFNEVRLALHSRLVSGNSVVVAGVY